MKVNEIKAMLKPLGTLSGINLYSDEPGPLFHYVSVTKGTGQQAIDAINQAGGDAMFVPACGNPYGDCIQVRRR